MDEVVEAMNKAEVDKAIILAPYPGGFAGGISDPRPTQYLQYSYLGVTQKTQERSAKFISHLQSEAPDRIVAFAWIEPRLKKAVQNAEEAVTKYECKGIKMIPDHWYPYEPRFFPLYEKIQDMKIPLLLHSGILFGFKDSSRFCRPCNYEVLITFPELKFALAHISRPWTDECTALFGRFRSNPKRDRNANQMQMYLDTTPGTPKFYRREALRKALSYGAEDYMIFGSDSTASNLQTAKYHAELDRGIIRKLGFSDVVNKIQSKNAEQYLGIPR
jgi:predicted TIM-barrel fold metal-dependent hydrolase